MDNIATYMLEGIAAVSILCCVLYLILLAKKSRDEHSVPFRGNTYASFSVTVRYEDSISLMTIYFYKDGLALERNNGKKLYIPVKNIVNIMQFTEEKSFGYKITFDPETSQQDSLELLCADDMTSDFCKIISEEKFGGTQKQ